MGKKEIYIPYNNYKVTSPEVKYKDLLQVGHLNPALTRNELHRVWVVEGTLKSGARHIYSKRTLFLDEDSWQAAVVDQYDGRGELWRVSIAYLKNYYDLPTTWSALDVFHDLQARRYHVQNLFVSAWRIGFYHAGSALTKHNVTPIVRAFRSSLGWAAC